MYWGEAIKDRQKLLGVFDNVLEINDEESSTNSFIEINLENTDNYWR